MSQLHVPVLLQEALEAMSVKADGLYVDATFGRGGHASALLNQLNGNGKIVALDQDVQAIKHAQKLFSSEHRVEVVHSNFDHLRSVLERLGVHGTVDGIMFDVGVSSPQIDEAERGFSFQQEGPLDMRMDVTQGMTAKEWLESTGESVIADALWRYGDESRSRQVAAAIKQALAKKTLNTTLDLALLVASKVKGARKKHPATKVFQALRVAVNDELNRLDLALEQAYEAIKVGGRLVVISFHSLEHRLVKQFSRRKQGMDDGLPRGLPIAPAQPLMRMVGRYKPQKMEIEQNVRARSAQMMALEKLA